MANNMPDEIWAGEYDITGDLYYESPIMARDWKATKMTGATRYIRADLCAAVSDAPTQNTPGTLLNEQRTSQPEMTGSSEVDRSERVFIAPTDKERAEALRLFRLIKERAKPLSVNNFDGTTTTVSALDILTQMDTLDFIERSLTAPDQSEVIKALVKALKFYATGKHYREGFGGTDVIKDTGQAAQKALALAEKAVGA